MALYFPPYRSKKKLSSLESLKTNVTSKSLTIHQFKVFDPFQSYIKNKIVMSLNIKEN